MATPHYHVSTDADALQAALLLAGRAPALTGRQAMTYQRGRTAVAAAATGLVVGEADGYSVYEADRGAVGRKIARITRADRG
jgi:hypothetical protein